MQFLSLQILNEFRMYTFSILSLWIFLLKKTIINVSIYILNINMHTVTIIELSGIFFIRSKIFYSLKKNFHIFKKKKTNVLTTILFSRISYIFNELGGLAPHSHCSSTPARRDCAPCNLCSPSPICSLRILNRS